jgi:AAA family ATP:ADP antiporter
MASEAAGRLHVGSVLPFRPTSPQFPRWLSPLKSVRRGEGASTAVFFCYAFVLLLVYYVLRTIREPLLLGSGSAELKSYAQAATALVLLVLLPLYGVVFRRTECRQLVKWVTTFFAATLLVFYALGRAGVDIGFAYYVWMGVFGVTMIAQFWAHAAHTYNVESGTRLFPVIMAGATLGALVGPPLSGELFTALGTWNLLLLAATALAITQCFVDWSWRSVPESSRAADGRAERPEHRVLGGIELVLRDRYLLLLAILAVLLNCVNTVGEYMLTELVLREADRLIALDDSLDRGALIAQFYSGYFFAVNAVTVILQLCVTARLTRAVGVRGALVVLPIVALLGYTLIALLPALAIVRSIKLLENGANYSIMNTARQSLYLPLRASQQFEGKTAVDTFFWRLGDLAQAGLVFVGLHWLGFELQHFAWSNAILAAIWLLVSLRIGGFYTGKTRPRVRLRSLAMRTGCASAALGVAACAVPHDAFAGTSLFDSQEPLRIELEADFSSLCRGGADEGCEETPATLRYVDDAGREQTIEASLRTRGKWRNTASHCTVPPLFVLPRAAVGTLFEHEAMLPLTTHCRERGSYEQYVLKEYLAYRIYNALTDKSLRVRLARVSYRDVGRRRRVVEMYGFFTEHFATLAARHEAQLANEFAPTEADPRELATFGLFQYLIGNTDWSALRGHNVTQIRAATGLVTAVPYDFDFSGIVDAEYAGPPPKLPIRSVTQRLFRGFCEPSPDWPGVFEDFISRRPALAEVVAGTPGLAPESRNRVLAYVASFYDVIESPRQREEQIVTRCRTGS